MFGIKSVLTCVSDTISCRLTPSLSLLVTSILHVVSAVDYSSLGVSNGWLKEMGLTDVPTSIPCTLKGNLDLQLNSITRIEANSFTCLDKIDTLDIGYNNLTYIASGAFDPLIILQIVRLRGNKYLPELPPHYGPNTPNMRHLYIQWIQLQTIPPESYFDQMPKLEHLATSIDLSNDFFNGWTDLQQFFFYGDIAPNLTDRTPNIQKIEINRPMNISKNMPNENVVGFTKLVTFRIKGCDRLPLFETSLRLKIVDARFCQITSLPDYRHLVSMTTFSPDTSRFYCDTQSCWMLFETISNVALKAVVQNIICHGPVKFKGLPVLGLSPVQLRCFDG